MKSSTPLALALAIALATFGGASFAQVKVLLPTSGETQATLALAGDARRIAQGDYHHRARPSESLEFDQLSASINAMADGLITEMGTHEELLARGGYYRRLYELQFQGEDASGGAEVPAAQSTHPAKPRFGPHPGIPRNGFWVVKLRICKGYAGVFPSLALATGRLKTLTQTRIYLGYLFRNPGDIRIHRSEYPLDRYFWIHPFSK